MGTIRVRLLLLGSALVTGLSLSLWSAKSEPIYAQGNGWGEPVMLSTNTVSSWWPDVVVGDDGRAYVVWNSGRRSQGDHLDLLMCSLWDGYAWSEPNDIVFPGRGGYTIRPAIAMDGQGNLHVTYRGGTTIYTVQSPASTAWDAASWSTPRRLSGTEAAYYSDVAVDSQGGIHVVWSEQVLDVDAGKVMWFGTPHGLTRYDGRLWQNDDSVGIEAGDWAVNVIFEDEAGVQWIGTSAGAGRYDGGTWHWFTVDDGLVSDQVQAIAEGLAGVLWFGTDKGVSLYDPQAREGEEWITFTAQDGLIAADVRAIAMDMGGAMWFGTSEGVSRYDGRVWTSYTVEDGLSGDSITAIVMDRTGALWFGTETGVSRYDGRSWMRFTSEDGLVDDRVNAVVVDRQGVLWFGTEGGLSRYDGLDWRSFTSADGLADDRVYALAVDSDRMLWVGTGGGVSRYDGQEWTTYTVEDGLAESQVTSIAEDRIPNAVCPMCSDIFYRRSQDGGVTWSAPVNLSDSYAGSVKPQITIDHRDGVHVVWEEGEDWYAGAGHPIGSAYIYSADGGDTWSEVTLSAHPDGAPQQITLAIGQEEELIIVWRLPKRLPQQSAVYYQRSVDNGASWSEAQPIEGIIAKEWLPMSLDACHSATDSAGNVHLLVLGYTSPFEEELSLLHVVWDGNEWSEPTRVFASSDPPEWPRIAIGMDNSVYATWFTRDEAHIYDSQRGRYQVWVASSRPDASFQTPAPLPTPMPTPTVAPEARVGPTPTPFPTIAPGSSTPPDGIYTESDDLVRLGIALAPVVGVLGAIFIVRWLWSKRR